MFRKLIDWMAGVPKETLRRAEDVHAGRVAVAGRLHAAQQVRAPIGGARCAGYYYKCTHKVSSRLKGYIRRKLSDALVYGDGLTLEMDGGTLALRPLRSERWGPEQHKILLSEDYLEFKATEDIIPAGAEVRVVGRARKGSDGALCLEFSELYRVDAEAPAKSKRASVRKGFRRSPKGGGHSRRS